MTPTDEGAPWKIDLLLLTVFFGALYLLGLGQTSLANPDEARYAEIAREMTSHDDWVTPRLNDIPYFEKPPLVYWTVGTAQALFGFGEFSARLTPAVFGLGGILLTYGAGRRLFGREAGLAAAIVLGTSLIYFILSRILLMDMVVSVLMSATLFCFLLGLREPAGRTRRWYFGALYASAALATLTKGLIGFAIPGAVMFLWLLVFNQWRRLRPFYLPSGIVIFLVIAGPWHFLAMQRNPGWAAFYFVHEHWERFTTTSHSRAEPFWYFIPVIILGLFPWIGFLVGALREGLAGGWAQRKENSGAWFLCIWAAFVLVFFSVSKSKLIPYILPVFPPLAVLLGGWLARRWDEGTASRLRLGLGVFAFICGLLGIGLLMAALKPEIISDSVRRAAFKPFGIALAVTLFVGGVFAPWAARVRGVTAGIGTMIATMFSFFAVLPFAAPTLERSGTKTLALVARERMQPADRVYHYWAFFHDFVYYAERPVGLVSYVDELEVQFLSAEEKAARFIDDAELRGQWSGSERVWLVVRKRDQASTASVFADPAFRYHLIAETRAHSLISNQP